MALENDVRLVGFCGCTPVMSGDSGKEVVRLPVYTEHTRFSQGQVRVYKEAHPCVFFGVNARRAVKLLLKGSQVNVVGAIHYHKFEKEGVSMKLAQVVVEDFKLTTKAMMTRELYDQIMSE